MDINQKKAQFSLAFIEAFAASLGFSHSVPSVDDDSIDILFTANGYTGKFRDPELRIQMKCTEHVLNQDGTLHFQLKKKNFNDLCGKNLIVPRYLIVLMVPPDYKEWLIEKPTNIELYHYALWYSLKNELPFKRKRSQLIRVPGDNLLTKEVFNMMMIKASDGESIV